MSSIPPTTLAIVLWICLSALGVALLGVRARRARASPDADGENEWRYPVESPDD